MPSSVHAQVRSHASPEAIFGLLADIETWSRWGAWESTTLESPDPDGGGGVGAIRRLTSNNGGYDVVSRERVEVVEPARRIEYSLLSGLPLRNYRGKVELTPDGDGTRIEWSSTFEPSILGTGWFYAWVLRRFMADAAARLARAAEAT